MAGVQPDNVQSIQAGWLKDWHRYLLNTYCEDCKNGLDVGCGNGYVMSNLKDRIKVRGVDIDPDQVLNARDRGLDVLHDDAQALIFEDRYFDLVYCSFALMWIKDPARAINEMVRVSRKRILILNEPIWNMAMVHPKELSQLVEAQKQQIIGSGGKLDMGIEMVDILKSMGLKFRFGTIPMNTSTHELEKWVEFERTNLEKSGVNIEKIPVTWYHVPFVWAVIDTSGR